MKPFLTERPMVRRFPFVFVFLFTALLICCAYYLHWPFNLRYDTEADYLDSLAVYRVHVIEQPVRKTDGWLVQANMPAYRQQAMFHLRTDSVQPAPAIGDILLVHTRLTRPHALFEGEFDYGNYLRLQHLVGIGYVRAGQWQIIGHMPVRTLRAYSSIIRHRLAQRYAETGLHSQALALISAITLGERDGLDADLRRSFAAAGAAHVLAVSGLHTAIIYMVIMSLLTCFGRRRPLYEQRVQRILLSLAIILAMWAYAFITGLSPSVTRAVLMLTIVQVGWMVRRQGVSLNTLAAAACICLWMDPLCLFSVSFQLSFAAVLGILLFVPHMNNAFPVKHSRLARWVRDMLTVSIAATIGTLPVTLYYFGQMPHYFLLTNIVILPVAYILVIAGLAVLLLAHTTLGAWLAVGLQYVGSWTCSLVGWIEHLPHSTLQLTATPWMVMCLVVAIGCCYMRIYRERLTWYAPAAAAIALFCVLHFGNVRQSVHKQELAIQGKTIYYNRGGNILRYPLNSRYTFFQYNGRNYVYAPYLSARQRQRLEQYCRDRDISIWEVYDCTTTETGNTRSLFPGIVQTQSH